MSEPSYEDQCKEAVSSRDHDKVLKLLPLLQGHDKIVCKVSAGLLLTLQYLATCTYLSDEGTYLLHITALYGWLTIVQLLVTSYRCSPLLKDTRGCVPLYYAALGGHLSVVQYFINDCNCDAIITNNYGTTPLHKAAIGGHLLVVQYLINECNCDAMITNMNGTTPLHKAAEKGHLSVVQYLIDDCKCDAMIANMNGAIPLHKAAEEGRLSVVQYFINDCNCDAMITDMNGTTPLHYSAFRGHLSVVQYFINDCNCDAMITNKVGATPLYGACNYNYNNHNIPVIQYLLSIPTVLNSFTQSSLSDPLGDALAVIDKFEQVKASHPVGLFVNILLLGNAGAGKTTLCQVIQQRSALHVTAQQTIEQVKFSTAGIVPTKLWDKHLGNVIIHDFAGQPAYYSSHTAIIENLLETCGAVFVVLINLTQDLSQQVRFWSSIVINEHHKVSSECHLIIIGSHADQVSNQLKRKLFILESHISKELEQRGCTVSSIFHLDCRLLSSDNLEAFVTSLSSLCASIRKKQSPAISLYCNFLYSLLEAKVSKDNVCTLYKLISLCDESEQESVPLPDDIVPLLKTLHSTGLIMYLENSEDVSRSWIVVNKEILLTEVDGILFAPSSFIEHRDIASNTGIITSRALCQLFSHHSVDMLILFLKSLKLCQEFDETLLKVTNLDVKSKESLGSGDKLLFFPALIEETRPQEINRTFQIGWCLKFISGIAFSIRFLHILLLNLAYGYAVPFIDSDHPLLPDGLQRLCYVWVNGIHWYNKDGVETLVEQVEDNQCVMMLMCCQSGAEEDMIQLHCKLIGNIISLQQEYCPMLECTEYLIDPSELQYPLDKPSQRTRYNMEQLRCHVSQKKENIRSDNNYRKQAVYISDLLPIEPSKYLNILKSTPQKAKDDELILEESDDHSKGDSTQPEHKQVLPTHMPLLMKILEPVWAEWELFGAALNIPFTKLQNIKSNNQVTLCHGDKLLKLQHVIYEFGKMTGSEKYTWKKIHKAVTDLGRKDIANKIKEDHKSLDEPLPLDPNTKELMPAEVLKTLRDIASNWMMFGIFLGVPHHKLKALQDSTDTNAICMYETLHEWISLKPEEATIQALIGAVRCSKIIDNELLAQHIESDPKVKEIFGP